MDIKFQFPSARDIDDLVANISEEDRLEICALGFTPKFALEHSIENAIEAVAIRKDGEIACIVGISIEPGLVGEIVPWLISANMMRGYPRKVLGLSKKILNHWRDHHPYLENYVDARHYRAIAWLRHIGAVIHPAEPYGPYGHPFHKFTFGEK